MVMPTFYCFSCRWFSPFLPCWMAKKGFFSGLDRKYIFFFASIQKRATKFFLKNHFVYFFTTAKKGKELIVSLYYIVTKKDIFLWFTVIQFFYLSRQCHNRFENLSGSASGLSARKLNQFLATDALKIGLFSQTSGEFSCGAHEIQSEAIEGSKEITEGAVC